MHAGVLGMREFELECTEVLIKLNLCGYGSTVDWRRTQRERMMSTSAMGSFSLHH